MMPTASARSDTGELESGRRKILTKSGGNDQYLHIESEQNQTRNRFKNVPQCTPIYLDDNRQLKYDINRAVLQMVAKGEN